MKKRARHGARKENEDKISALPDCILLHILTFMKAKQVVQTCVLSKRWKDLWKHVPALLLNSSQFERLALFTKFVTKVLSCRDGSAALCILDFTRRGYVEPQILKRLARYAVSHGVQQLRVYCIPNLELPPTIFSCQSLTSLKLSVSRGFGCTFLFPKSLCMTALANLHLEFFTFCPSGGGRAEPFSKCKMLHTMVLVNCTVRDAQVLCISNARVAHLTMRSFFNDTGYKIVLSTPNLGSFAFENSEPKELVGSNLSFLEEVYIDVRRSLCLESALILNRWLQVVTNLKSIAVSTNTVKVLCLIPDLQNMRSSSSVNSNSLEVQFKVRFAEVPVKAQKEKIEPSSALYGLIDYLLQYSQSAEVAIICC